MPTDTAPADPDFDRRIEDVRSFNRFYTGLIGVLNEGILQSPFTLAEARLLFEIAHEGEMSAADLARDLNMDPAQVSRLVQRLKRQGLLELRENAADRRSRLIGLTAAGQAAYAELDQRSRHQIGKLLGAHAPERQEAMVEAMRTIKTLFLPRAAGDPFLLRPHRTGDIGWLVSRQALLYRREYGWDSTYEGLAAEIAGSFAHHHDPERERCWIAERGGVPVGAVMLVDAGNGVAQLRLLHVEPQARGLGIGRALITECIRFARSAGYVQIMLWTQDCLAAARRLYEAAGFRLVKTERHMSFGKELNGEYWELDL